MSFVLFRKRGAKSWQGATRIKKGVRSTQVQSFLRKFKKPGIETRIVSQAELNKVITKQSGITSRRRKVRRRTTRRRKR